jgi:hypothetical protein
VNARRRLHLAGVLALLVAACAQPGRAPGPTPAAAAAPTDFPRTFYRQAAARGEQVLRVDPAASLVAITVRRAGSLARLGHDHIVASHDLQGYVAPGANRADLYLSLDSLTVDEPALRADAGFDTQPSASDIAGTRANMLDKVLQAPQFPFALIHVSAGLATAGGTDLKLDITLHGTTRGFSVPARIESGRGELRASGTLAFDQSSFGIAPFSILGGAIQVQDRIELRFDVRAREPSGPGPAP